MLKSEYRDTILRMMDYVKVTKFCKPCGISQSALSYFLKGRDELLSVQKLEFFVKYIRNTINDL